MLLIFINNYLLKHFFIKLLLFTFYWILYLELNPQITGIWLRPDENNELVFCPYNILNLIIQPFKSIEYWTHYQLWDVNYFIAMFFLIFMHALLNFLYLEYFIK